MKIKDFADRLAKRIEDGAQAPIFDFNASGKSGESEPQKFQRDEAYEASEGISECLTLVRSRAPLILVSGRAGTGKSRLIRYLEQVDEHLRQIVVAPTGISALTIGAATIHKAFMLPFGVIDAAAMKPRGSSKEMEKIERLIIDEISMVRADMLDAIDQRLRQMRSDPRPFGGVQVVMVGDFLQLPPVVPRDEEEMLARLGYLTPYAFSAKVVEEMDLKVVTLTKVWRQADEAFVSVLARIRSGRANVNDIEWLNKQCLHPPREGTQPLLLTPTRAAAQRYNDAGIRAERNRRREALGLPGDVKGETLGEHLFKAKRQGTFEGDAGAKKTVPVPDHLSLLPGVRVMAVKNDGGGSFVNGSLGTVIAAYPGDEENEPPFVEVQFDGAPEPVRVGRVSWEEIKHQWNEKSGAIEKTITGSYTQIPLVLGYAVTIHKSQGLTLDDMRLDLGSGTFSPGMLYVALSRASSTVGLSFVRPVQLRDMRTDEITTQFLTWAQENAQVEVINREAAPKNEAALSGATSGTPPVPDGTRIEDLAKKISAKIAPVPPGMPRPKRTGTRAFFHAFREVAASEKLDHDEIGQVMRYYVENTAWKGILVQDRTDRTNLGAPPDIWALVRQDGILLSFSNGGLHTLFEPEYDIDGWFEEEEVSTGDPERDAYENLPMRRIPPEFIDIDEDTTYSLPEDFNSWLMLEDFANVPDGAEVVAISLALVTTADADPIAGWVRRNKNAYGETYSYDIIASAAHDVKEGRKPERHLRNFSELHFGTLYGIVRILVAIWPDYLHTRLVFTCNHHDASIGTVWSRAVKNLGDKENREVLLALSRILECLTSIQSWKGYLCKFPVSPEDDMKGKPGDPIVEVLATGDEPRPSAHMRLKACGELVDLMVEIGFDRGMLWGAMSDPVILANLLDPQRTVLKRSWPGGPEAFLWRKLQQ